MTSSEQTPLSETAAIASLGAERPISQEAQKAHVDLPPAVTELGVVWLVPSSEWM